MSPAWAAMIVPSHDPVRPFADQHANNAFCFAVQDGPVDVLQGLLEALGGDPPVSSLVLVVADVDERAVMRIGWRNLYGIAVRPVRGHEKLPSCEIRTWWSAAFGPRLRDFGRLASMGPRWRRRVPDGRSA
jgi:hypothetical protein